VLLLEGVRSPRDDVVDFCLRKANQSWRAARRCHPSSHLGHFVLPNYFSSSFAARCFAGPERIMNFVRNSLVAWLRPTNTTTTTTSERGSLEAITSVNFYVLRAESSDKEEGGRKARNLQTIDNSLMAVGRQRKNETRLRRRGTSSSPFSSFI
jgi:hypothetical protein